MLGASLVVAGCASIPKPAADEVGRVLDAWHAAAAAADEERYFAAFAPSGVFVGTDATERWDVPAFRAYAHPHFAKGKAWTMVARRRAVAFDANGTVAWFDEDVDSARMGPLRGSGVLVREGRGPWRIAQYVLSLPVPNDRFPAVRAAADGH